MSNAPINYGTASGPTVNLFGLGSTTDPDAAVQSYIGGGTSPDSVNNIAGQLAQQGQAFQNVASPNVYNQGMAQWAGYGSTDQQQQLSALANLQAQAQGNGNYGQGTVQQGLAATQANQNSLAASAGQGARGALALRTATDQNALSQTQAQNTARILQAQGQAAGQGAYQQGLNQYQQGLSQEQQLEQQAIEQQAAVNQQQQNLADWAQEQYQGQAQGIEAAQLGATTNAYNSAANAGNQQNIANANAAAAQSNALTGGSTQAAGTIMTAAAIAAADKGQGSQAGQAENTNIRNQLSDIRAKSEIQPQGKHMNGRPMNSQMVKLGEGTKYAPMGHALSEGAKANPMMTGQMAGQRFGQPGGMAPRPPLGQVMGPSPQYMGALRQGMSQPMGYHGGNRANGVMPPMGPRPGAPAPAGPPQGVNPALAAGAAPQMGGAPPMGQAMAAPPQQFPQFPQSPMMARGYGGLVSDERAKIVSRDLMSDNGLSTGRMLLEGQGDPNHKYRPIDDNVGIRQEYAPPPSITSDERAKVGDMGDVTEADHFLAHLHPYTYKYKDPSYEPTDAPTGGHYLGVMAQDVEQVPGIGHQIVKDTPRGKMLEGGALMSAMAGGLGRLHERVSALEGSRGRVQ